MVGDGVYGCGHGEHGSGSGTIRAVLWKLYRNSVMSNLIKIKAMAFFMNYGKVEEARGCVVNIGTNRSNGSEGMRWK